MKSVKNIKQLIKKFHVSTNAKMDQKVREDVLEVIRKSKQTQSALTQPNIWRIIMKSNITKLAAAAVIIIALFFGLNIFFSDGSGVAWGEVLNNVQKIQTYVNRMKMTVQSPKGSRDLWFTNYQSTEFGTRRDSFYNDELISQLYIPAKGNTGVELVPSQKKYVNIVFTDEQLKEIAEKNDPRAIVKEFMSYNEYSKIGRMTIDGIEVEGIEVDNEQFGASLFEKGKGRLWVAVDTDLPVLIELEGTSAGGSVQISLTIDSFDWDPGLQAEDFQPNIPSDYTLMAEVDLSGSVEAIVKGLRGFAEITEGKYPTNLDMMTTAKEIKEAFITLRQKQGKSLEEKPTQEEMEKMLSIQGACLFYGKLVKENKDAAYYGGTVTPQDVEKVLMRWKISDQKYRVIFGDLSTLDINYEELAELEK
jgi:hypothetical protein